ncbi:MAG: hypothetical protein JF615_07110 [Asticcacaulis sp.]|nr:hypothetical protein [Asticcacaulis sp.]
MRALILSILNPSQAMAETFKGCHWQEVRGKTLSIWAYACGHDFGDTHLVADDTIGGFGLVNSGADADSYVYSPVIRTFTKAADAPIDALLPDIRKLSPGPDTATCVFEPAQDPTEEQSTRKLYAFVPTGAAMAKWDKNVDTGNDPTPPCGPMGPSFAGDRLFEVLPDDATKVVYIEFGSEIQIFDTATLKPVKP